MNNGYYYNVNGLFDKQITNGSGDKNEVYIFDRKDSKGLYVNARNFGLKYSEFVVKCKTV